MAGPERFELPTSSFEDLLSIQLNYGPINLARVLGLEPRITESKSVVLPLHYTRTETGLPTWIRTKTTRPQTADATR